MAFRNLVLFIDVPNRRLVKAFTSNEDRELPDLVQGSKLKYELFFVQERDKFVEPFTYLDFSGSSYKVAISDTPTGTAGGPSLLAQATTGFTEITNGVRGSLDLNTTAVATHLGGDASKTTYFEVEVTDPEGDTFTALQKTFTLLAEAQEPTVSAPNPSLTYYTKPEVDTLFVKWLNTATQNQGKLLTLVSSDGSHRREIGVGSSGEKIDNVICGF